MLIYILNKNFAVIDILRKYTFSQYTNKFRDVGTFQIQVQIADDNMFLLTKEPLFVLFDDIVPIAGKINSIEKDSDSEFEKTFVIKGTLMEYVLKKRVIDGTLVYTNVISYEFVKSIIDNISNKDDTARYLNNETTYEDEQRLNEVCSIIVDKQITGGYAWDAIQPVLDQDKLGIKIVPNVISKKDVNGVETNIDKWRFIISSGTDRTKFNAYGNDPVVFSQSLSNIERTSYAYDTEKYAGIAYIAGEGEGANRKWYNMYASEEAENEIGWNRSELWVDARDIQSETEEGTLTDEEYTQLITNRGNEKFAENTKTEKYTSTIMQNDKRYKYGEQYFLGDFVTIVDDELGIEVNVQITGVTKSVQGNQEIVDIEYTYGAFKQTEDVQKELRDIKQKLEEANTNIAYLLKKVEQVSKSI